MTADAPTASATRTDAGAPSRSEVDWKKIHQEVRRLQVRIAKATSEAGFRMEPSYGLEPCDGKLSRTVLRGGGRP